MAFLLILQNIAENLLLNVGFMSNTGLAVKNLKELTLLQSGRNSYTKERDRKIKINLKKSMVVYIDLYN